MYFKCYPGTLKQPPRPLGMSWIYQTKAKLFVSLGSNNETNQNNQIIYKKHTDNPGLYPARSPKFAYQNKISLPNLSLFICCHVQGH